MKPRMLTALVLFALAILAIVWLLYSPQEAEAAPRWRLLPRRSVRYSPAVQSLQYWSSASRLDALHDDSQTTTLPTVDLDQARRSEETVVELDGGDVVFRYNGGELILDIGDDRYLLTEEGQTLHRGDSRRLQAAESVIRRYQAGGVEPAEGTLQNSEAYSPDA